MSIQLKIFESQSTDPFINLSIEQQILMNIKSNERVLLFYKNKPSIVLGRFQNPWLECDLNQLIENNVMLVRRQSGGGCVYHDLGNLNFSFIYPEREYHKEQNNKFIINALEDFSIEAYASGRSDLLVDNAGPKKISGSAFKQKKDRSFHHGTLLFNCNLTHLNKLLTRTDIKIENTKSIASNPATVINLCDLNPAINEAGLKNSLINQLENYYEVSAQKFSSVELLEMNYHDELTNWNWLWGETPEFEFEFKNFQVKMRKGILKEVILEGHNLIKSEFKLIPNDIQKEIEQNPDLAEILDYLKRQIERLSVNEQHR